MDLCSPFQSLSLTILTNNRKVIRKRNRETAIKDKISRKRSTDRGSQAHNGADGRYLSGQTHR